MGCIENHIILVLYISHHEFGISLADKLKNTVANKINIFQRKTQEFVFWMLLSSCT